MRYTGLELFMEKLKHMIYGNDNPLNNHPSVLSERPQLQLLYEEVDYMIKTLQLIDEHQEFRQPPDLMKRFVEVAEEAHDIVDLFAYNINLGNEISLNQISLNQPPASHPKTKSGCHSIHTWNGGFRFLVDSERIYRYINEKNKCSLNIEDVMRSIKSMKEELVMSLDKVKMDSSSRIECVETPSVAVVAGTTCSKDPLGAKKLSEDIVVGFDRHAEVIRDKLVEDQKQLDVISIVGMGGLGKTTLAIKVFNDPFVMYHFHVRGWVTVSQTYEKKDLLIQLLGSVGIKLETTRSSYSQLREMLHKRLMGNRYLIVLDDIWSTEAWDDIKLFFPNNQTGSRIFLTSRLKEVALHAKSHDLIHQLEYLTEGESWELLCKKVFRGGNHCPESLIKLGMQIAKNCHGLPLTLVAIAGVLAKGAVSRDSWESIGRSVSSWIVNDETGYKETLALSIDYLPRQLRHCFLYLGGFPEDYKFRARRLIWLWMAEGFVQEDGIRSSEEIAEDYLMELVDRNLVVVAARKSNGGIKSFYIHDLLRELCSEVATKENFCVKTRQLPWVASYKQRRIFIEDNSIIWNAPRIRSLLCFQHEMVTRSLCWSYFWMLLMVLDLQYGHGNLDRVPDEISLLVHLRYLALLCRGDLPSSICNLWSLQTLIISERDDGILELPKTISNLVNLRHVWCDGLILFPAIQKPMNLHTISNVGLADAAESLVVSFPGIKKLQFLIQQHKNYDFESLTFLENLKLKKAHYRGERFPRSKLNVGFPTSLKKLTLQDCYLPWSDMPIIQSLPNLEVLKLQSNSFVGPQWDAGEEQFRQLKFLKLYKLEFKKWEASYTNFSRLTQLVLDNCHYLKKIPSEIGYVPTLELINVVECSDYVEESIHAIQEEQHAQGNFELKIIIKERMRLTGVDFIHGFRLG